MGAPHIVKKCGCCGKIKSVDEFYRSGKTKRDGYCRACRRKKDRDRAVQKAARHNPEAQRAAKLKCLYGITQAEYDAMAEAQGYVCRICLDPETRSAYGEKPRLVVDHNHDTGRVRGLLCAACNGKLASIENEQFMLRAQEYLRDLDGYVFMEDDFPFSASGNAYQ